MAQKDVLVARLEAVVQRLERFADGLPAGGAGAAAGGAAAAELSPALQAYDSFVQASVTPFVNATKAFKETVRVGEMTVAACSRVRDVLEAASACKKPSDAELAAFIEPISKVLAEADRLPDKRNVQWFPFHKSFAEATAAFGWVLQASPKQTMECALEAADFHLINILTAAKKLSGEPQAQSRAYVATLKAMLTNMAAFAVEFYKLGITWNPKGGALSAFKPGAGGAAAAAAAPEAPAAPDAPDAPAAPPPPADDGSSGAAAKPSSGGMSAVFGQLNSLGEGGVTKGLKKVTKDMKTKNMKDVPVLQPKEEKKKAPVAAAEKKKEKKPPKLELAQGTWFCENYEDQADMAIPDVEMKQNVYISRCKNCRIRIPDKVKSIQIDSCSKVSVSFKAVVSTFEVVNSQSVTADCSEQCPSFTLDKSNGVQVILSKAVVDQAPAPPDIVSSSITACNLVVPGKSEKDDPIEIPLPEQYMTKFDVKTGKISTEAIKHSG